MSIMNSTTTLHNWVNSIKYKRGEYLAKNFNKIPREEHKTLLHIIHTSVKTARHSDKQMADKAVKFLISIFNKVITETTHQVYQLNLTNNC